MNYYYCYLLIITITTRLDEWVVNNNWVGLIFEIKKKKKKSD